MSAFHYKNLGTILIPCYTLTSSIMSINASVRQSPIMQTLQVHLVTAEIPILKALCQVIVNEVYLCGLLPKACD